MPAAWGGLGLLLVAAAAGVAWRCGWARSLAVIVAAPALALSAVGVAAAFLRLDLLALVTALPGAGADFVVLFAVLRRWPSGGPDSRRRRSRS